MRSPLPINPPYSHKYHVIHNKKIAYNNKNSNIDIHCSESKQCKKYQNHTSPHNSAATLTCKKSPIQLAQRTKRRSKKIKETTKKRKEKERPAGQEMA